MTATGFPAPSAGYVYFILDHAADPLEVKIGHTVDLHGRRRALQRQYPERRLTLFGYFRGGLNHERALHRRFADGALGHEWFRWDTPGLQDFAHDAATFDAFWPEGVMPDGSMSDFSERILSFYAEVPA